MESMTTVVNEDIGLIANTIDETDYDEITKHFCRLDVNSQLDILNNWSYPIELLYFIINQSESGIVINRIVNGFDIDLASLDLDIYGLFEKAKTTCLENQKLNESSNSSNVISIPVKLITTKLAQRIWDEELAVYSIRNIITAASYSTDPSLLNELIKKREKLFIENYNGIVEGFKKVKSIGSGTQKYVLARDNLSRLLEQVRSEKLLHLLSSSTSIPNTLSFLLVECIVDYLFETPDNLLKEDLGELIAFHDNGHIDLTADRRDIYYKILHIDELTDEEKLALYRRLQDRNICEEFYADIDESIKRRNEDIKDSCLTKEKMYTFLDSELSSKYGVPVYSTGDAPFIALVKSIVPNQITDKLPTGHSFSIISDENPKDTYYGNCKYLYDVSNMNPKQIVHVSPCDADTKYRPYLESERSTEAVNRLMTSKEIVKNTNRRSEILILEQGTTKTDMDDKIPKLDKMAVYCVDQISEEDVKRAKNEKLGIFLAYSKKKEDKPSQIKF